MYRSGTRKNQNNITERILRKFPRLDERAVSAVIFLYFLGFIAIIVCWMIAGPVVDALTGFHNNATQGTPTSPATIPVSQERQTAISFTQIIYHDYPLIGFIILTIAAVVAAAKWRGPNIA